MVHKRYIKKNGKLIGPYYYESYRENGRVKKRYLGSVLPVGYVDSEEGIVEKSMLVPARSINNGFSLSVKSVFAFMFFIFVGFLVVLLLFSNVNTSMVVLDLSPRYVLNDVLAGQAIINIESGDYLPSDSAVYIKLVREGEVVAQKTESLNDFFSGNLDSHEISDSREVCEDKSVVKIEQVCQNTGSDGVESCEDKEVETTERVCNSESISLGNVYDSPGKYERSLEELISYNLSEPGEYEITFALPSFDVAVSKTFEVVGNVPSESVSEPVIGENAGDGGSGGSIYANESIEIADNETVVVNETIVEPEQVNESTNETIVDQNESINESISVMNNVSVTTTRARIRLGEPVKWTKNVSLDVAGNVTIEIPAEAENVEVTKLEDGEVVIANDFNVVTGNVVTGNVVKEQKGKGWIYKMFALITGKVVDESIDNSSSIPNLDVIEVQIEENATEYVVEYETPAPTATETETSNGKEVVISAPDGLGYTDVLSFTEINELIDVGNEDIIKIYWKEAREYVPFDAYDLNGNGKIDYLEWITPHLSNQTFEIILITKAELLDSTRGFIADVYGEVNASDGLTVRVNDSQYLRVAFEKKLTNEKDITIYARALTENAEVIVYEKDGVEELARFTDIGSEISLNKIYLTNLVGEQDTFDLLSVGDVEYDYVVDPTTLLYNCSVLSSPETYVLQNDVLLTNAYGSYCFEITSNDVVLDGNGYSLAGTTSDDFQYGVWISGHSNITVKNFDSFLNFPVPGNQVIFVSNGENINILNNTFGSLVDWPIALYSNVSDFNISYNTIGTIGFGRYGLDIDGLSSGGVVSWNNFTGFNLSALVYYNSSGLSILSNNFSSSSNAINLGGYANDTLVNGNNFNSNNISIVVGASSFRNNFTSNTFNSNNYSFYFNSNNDSLVSGNSISGPSAYEVYLIGGNGNLFDGQIVSSYLLSSSPVIRFNNSNGSLDYISGLSGNGTNLFGNSSSDIIIRNNSVYVNSSKTGLNVSANVTLYGVGNRGFTNPTIMRDGQYVCNSTTSSKCYNFTALNATNVKFNISSWSNYSIGELPDIIKPNLTVYSPIATNYTNASILVNFTASDNVAVASKWFNNGTANITYTTPVVVNVSDGNHTFAFYANDSSGNENSTSVVFNIDSLSPNVTIYSPTNTTYSTNSYGINITINESGDCLYSLDNGATNLTLTNNSGLSFTASKTGVANGAYTLHAYCNDSAGNRNDSVSVNFSINVVQSGGNNGGSSGGSSICSSNSWNCGSWSECSLGVQTRECADNCGSSKSETQTCTVLNETCVQDWQCSSWSACSIGLSIRSCNDVNKCEDNSLRPAVSMECVVSVENETESELNILEKLTGDHGNDCAPDVVCGEYGECKYSANVNDLFAGVIRSTGTQTRECNDKNSCIRTYFEENSCKIDVPVDFVTSTDPCNSDKITVTALKKGTKDPVVQIDALSWAESKTLNVQFLQNSTVYCENCYNGRLDEGEEDVDCGGSCIECKTGSNWINIVKWVLWILVILLLLIDLLLILLRRKDKSDTNKKPVDKPVFNAEIAQSKNRIKQSFIGGFGKSTLEIINLINEGYSEMDVNNIGAARLKYRAVQEKYAHLKSKDKSKVRDKIIEFYNEIVNFETK